MAFVAAPLAVQGMTGTFGWERHAKDDDFVQAGNLYRLMAEAEKERLVANIADSLSRVSRDDVIARSIGYSEVWTATRRSGEGSDVARPAGATPCATRSVAADPFMNSPGSPLPRIAYAASSSVAEPRGSDRGSSWV